MVTDVKFMNINYNIPKLIKAAVFVSLSCTYNCSLCEFFSVWKAIGNIYLIGN